LHPKGTALSGDCNVRTASSYRAKLNSPCSLVLLQHQPIVFSSHTSPAAASSTSTANRVISSVYTRKVKQGPLETEWLPIVSDFLIHHPPMCRMVWEKHAVAHNTETSNIPVEQKGKIRRSESRECGRRSTSMKESKCLLGDCTFPRLFNPLGSYFHCFTSM